MEDFVVCLDFQAIQAPSQEDLARMSVALRPDDEESCVWTGEAASVLKVCIDVTAADFPLAAVSAVRELDAVMLALGLAGEVRKIVACNGDDQLVVQGADLQGIDRRRGQTYCDWCMGPLTPSSIAQSERLGLNKEFAWACNACLAQGAHHRPFDGWDPPESEWPFREAQ